LPGNCRRDADFFQSALGQQSLLGLAPALDRDRAGDAHHGNDHDSKQG